MRNTRKSTVKTAADITMPWEELLLANITIRIDPIKKTETRAQDNATCCFLSETLF